MIIKWNEVTWYSKIFALILFVLLPFIGFYVGIKYQMLLEDGITVNRKFIFERPQKNIAVSTTTKEKIAEKNPLLLAEAQGDKIGYIRKIYEMKDGMYIDLDEIQMFRGRAAQLAEKEDGVCAPYHGDGIETDCFIPSGYYIRNKDALIQSLQVASDAKITVLSDCYNLKLGGIPISINDFKSNFGVGTACSYPGAASFYVPNYTPYFIRQDTKGVITSILQEYVP